MDKKMDKKIIPIQEYLDDKGMLLDGEGIVLNQTKGAEGRGIDLLIGAIRRFEEDNDLPKTKTTRNAGEGNEAFKKRVIKQYNIYMGVSHRYDSFLNPYLDRLKTVAKRYDNKSALSQLIAQVYYAVRNGLTEGQINFILDNFDDHKGSIDYMRNLRYGFQSGLGKEQVGVLALADVGKQKRLMHFMLEGGGAKGAAALIEADGVQYDILSPYVKAGYISPELVQAVVRATRYIRQWDIEYYARQQKTKPTKTMDINLIRTIPARHRFSDRQYKGFVEYMTGLALANKTITPRTLIDIARRFVDQMETDNLEVFLKKSNSNVYVPQEKVVRDIKREKANRTKIAGSPKKADVPAGKVPSADNKADQKRKEVDKKKFSDIIFSVSPNGSGLKELLMLGPEVTPEFIKSKYPQLEQFSDFWLQYLLNSRFVRNELVPLLDINPKQFVDIVYDRMSNIDNIISGNGMFVEVISCNCGSDIPLNGALMNPGLAESLIATLESHMKKVGEQLRNEDNNLLPAWNCDITIYQMNKERIVNVYDTCIKLGEGKQWSIYDHLEQKHEGGPRYFAIDFGKAISERHTIYRALLNGDICEKEQFKAEIKKYLSGSKADIKAITPIKSKPEQFGKDVEALVKAAKGDAATQGKDQGIGRTKSEKKTPNR